MKLNEESTWRLKIDAKEYHNEMRQLQKELTNLKESQKDLEKGTKEYAENADKIKEVQAEFDRVRDAADLATFSVKELKKFQGDLVKSIRDLVPGTEEYIRKTEQLKEVNTRLRDVRSDVTAIHDEVKPGKWTQFKQILAAAFTVTGLLELWGTLKQFGSEAIDLAVKLTDTYADMQKATGLTNKEVKDLDETLKTIDTRTAQDGLREMTVVAGQLGIEGKENIEGFVRGIDKANVALGDEFQGGVEEISKSLGGLKRIFADTKDMGYEEALTRIGSALNTLGATGSAKAPDIANFASRVAQLGDLAPKSAAEILGLGSGFLELNVSAEIASSGLKNVFTTGASDIPAFAAQLGISKQKMEDLINTNPNEFLFKLAESFKGATPTQMVAQLNQLGIRSQEGQAAVMLLAKNTDFFKDRQKTANQAAKEGTSIQEEFNIKNTNDAAIKDKQTKALLLQKEALGNQLLPVQMAFYQVIGAGMPLLTGLISMIGFITTGLIALPKFILDNKAAFGFFTLAIVTLNKELAIASALQLKKAALDKAEILWTNAKTAAHAALNLVMRANPIALVVTALALLAGGLLIVYRNTTAVKAVLNSVSAAMMQFGREVVNLFSAIGRFDFAAAGETLMNGWKRIASASSKAYNEELKKGKAEEKKIRDEGNKDDKDGHTAKEDAKTKKEREEQEKRQKENEKALAELLKGQNDGVVSHGAGEEKKTKKTTDEAKKRKEELKKIEEELQDFRDSQRLYEEQQETSLQNKKLQALARTTDAQVLTTNLTMLRENNLTNNRMVNLEKLHKLELQNIEKSKLSQEEKAKRVLEVEARQLSTMKDLHKLNHEAFVALMEKELLKVRGNAFLELDIKKRMLDEQVAYKIQTLETEAALEINRIQQSVMSTEEKAARIKAIEDNLSAQLVQTAANTVEEKRRLEVEAYEKRWNRSKEFYSAVQAAMDGDFLAFTSYLQKKAIEDGKHINLRLVEFAKHAVAIGGILVELLNKQIELNKKSTEDKVAELDKQKEAQFKTLDEQLEKGVITEEEYKTQKLRIGDEYDAQVRELKRIEFEKNKKLQIANALIMGSLAVLSALATPPFPVGLGLAIVAGVKTAIDIKKIKDQKFEYAKGGYVRNAGVPEGPRHGSRYGESGIALMNRETGEEMGEMEGGEPILILSRNTYKNNKPVVDKLMESSLYRNGEPIFENGGVIEPLRFGQKYEFGTRQRRGTVYSPDTAVESARNFNEDVTDEQVAQFSAMSMDAQTSTAENTGLSVEVLNEISAGLGRYLPEFERIMNQQISQQEMLRQLLDLQNAILNRISDNTSRAADAATQSKRNDL